LNANNFQVLIKVNPELREKPYGKVHTAESRKSTGDSAGGKIFFARISQNKKIQRRETEKHRSIEA
jgi:hypothetical protein